LVDLGRITSLNELAQKDGYLHLGARVSLARIAASAEVRERYAALAKAAASVGNPQIRNVATIGGNVALGLPVADLPPALLALDAEVVYRGPDGEQRLPILRVITDGVPTGCLITAVRIPRESERRSGFLKFSWRQASGKTIVSVAAALRIEDGLIAAPRLTVGGLARSAARLPQTEQILAGRAWSQDLAEEAASAAAAEPVFDASSPPGENYRRRLVSEGVRRILAELARL
jgi:CO/xanthine dehydrogenase FAD-binding subunit